ncbi:MAG TPA: sulfatase-like hydrolase/transferase [Gemmataceae bacterium]|nr:sulfatase-like hydrolase/transferase [Gemmataceae bacterium]
MKAINGWLNSNSDAGSVAWACDQAIYNDFAITWASNRPNQPWFACVSFVNPHDSTYYPGFFPPNEPLGSQGEPGNPDEPPPPNTSYFNFQPQHANYVTQVISGQPSPWNFEQTQDLQNKSWDSTATIQDKPNFLQPYFQQYITDVAGNPPLTPTPPQHLTPLAAGDYTGFINWYYYMISLVDANIGQVLSTAIPGYNNTVTTNPSSTTAIIFLSDHGEYAGSHGLHAKAGAVYDEGLRVPLYVVTPSQQNALDFFHMCSMVDLFMLVVELALGTTYNWQNDPKYKDQYYNRNQSLFSFLKTPTTAETRGYWGTDGNWYPFILTTADETHIDQTSWNGKVYPACACRNHVMCIRTKSDANINNFSTAWSGGKLAIYSKWVTYPGPNYDYSAPIVDGTLPGGELIIQDYEYYDYLNYNNRAETGNDYPAALNSQGTNGAGAHQLLTDMLNQLGNMQIWKGQGQTQQASGLAASVLTRQLTGVSSSIQLSTYTINGIKAWYSWLQPKRRLHYIGTPWRAPRLGCSGCTRTDPTMKPQVIFLATVLAIAGSSSLAAQTYTFQTILYCNNLTAFPVAMNGAGLVVGQAHDINSTYNSGMVYQNGTCQTYPKAAFWGVTDTGGILEELVSPPGMYLREPGGKLVGPLPSYPGSQGSVYCCVDTVTGTLAGTYSPGPPGIFSGFFYQNGKFTSLPWAEPSGSSSYWFTLTALNNTGAAVGTFNGQYTLGFLYRNGTMTFLGYPGAKYTNFYGLNDNGVVVGVYTMPNNANGVFIYNIGTGVWTDLNFPAPYNLMIPVGISNAGMIALQYSAPGGMVIATPTGQ